MSAQRKPNGQWFYRITMRFPDGHRERISGTPMLNTKKAALEAEAIHVARILNPPVEKQQIPEFAEFAEEWLRVYPPSVGNRHGTQEAHKQHLRSHLIPFFAGMTLDRIDTQSVARLYANLKGTGRRGSTERTLSPLTVRNIGATLHKLLVCAQQWGKITTVPIWPAQKYNQPQWDFYTAEETRALLAAAPPEDRLMLLFALRTGARAGEQLALEWGDIDFVRHQVTFRRSIRQGIEGSTKTGKGRTVPLSPALEEELQGAKHLLSEKVFCQPNGQPWELWHLAARLRRAQRKAGLRRIRWHDLRHSFASQAMIAGVQIRQVQEWLGHSTILMTMRYAHLARNSDQIKLVSLLDG